ncbi:MAG: DoxX family protein [Candidatus Devosia euplotis]|nr:DoxX family protein [Candidatus Devosia euplotis]
MASLTHTAQRAIGAAEQLIAVASAFIGLLALRLEIAIPFWRSGLTKWDGFLSLSAGARYLFEQEFKLHVLGQAIIYPLPLVMVFLSGVGEIVLPVLLVPGLFTRFAALGILVMTIIIQLTISDGLINFHLPWAAIDLSLMAFGGGKLPVDAAMQSVGGRRQGDAVSS